MSSTDARPAIRGITQASLADKAVPQPFRAHPLIPHIVGDLGCTVCHRGQGPATEVAGGSRIDACLGTTDIADALHSSVVWYMSLWRPAPYAAADYAVESFWWN